GIAPILEQACFHGSERFGSPFTRTLPSTDSSSAGCALRAGATFANRASRASTAARRVEELTPPGVVEQPEPPERGYNVSPIYKLIVSIGMPSVSAATITIVVRVPVPM